MTAKNDITGAKIQTKAQSEAYAKGWDRIFGKKPASGRMLEYSEPTEEGATTVRLTEEEAIRIQKEQAAKHGMLYVTEREALDDFVCIHHAVFV